MNSRIVKVEKKKFCNWVIDMNRATCAQYQVKNSIYCKGHTEWWEILKKEMNDV